MEQTNAHDMNTAEMLSFHLGEVEKVGESCSLRSVGRLPRESLATDSMAKPWPAGQTTTTAASALSAAPVSHPHMPNLPAEAHTAIQE